MNRLKELRKKQGLSLQGLSDISGVSKESISCYERGKRNPKIESWRKLAYALGVPVPYLRGADDEQTKKQDECPFCHENEDGFTWNVIESDDDTPVNIERDVSNGQITYYLTEHNYNYPNNYDASFTGIINYCPKCGRKLVEEG